MTTTQSNRYGVPVVSLPEERERVEYYGVTLEVLLRAETTGGQFFAVHHDLTPADAPPFHVHTREDEIWIVRSGTFRFWIGGDSLATAEVRDVGPGGVVYGPRDVAHTYQSLEPTSGVYVLWSPADSQGYFLGVGGSAAREDFEHLDRLEEYGVHVLDRAPVDGA